MSEERCRQCGVILEDPGLCPECAKLEVLPDKIADWKQLTGVPFQDMKSLDETKRWEVIVGHLKAHPGKKIAVMVDCGPSYEGKAERYIQGVTRLLPAVKVMGRKPGPVRGVESIIFQL